MRLSAVTAGLVLAGATVLSGQKVGRPQPPCTIEPGHFRITSAVLDLKIAAEQPNQRDRMLAQARDVLVRSIRDDKQDANPAAWYYLGRYSVEVGDAAGADTAFTRAETLAPQCKADIAAYRGRLSESMMNQGLTLWQAGNADSAIVLLRLAYAVDRTNPRPLFQLGNLYAGQNMIDSTAAVLREGCTSRRHRQAFADAKRDALLTVARLAYRTLQGAPAVQQWQHTRYSRDSLTPYLAADSTVLARVQQSSASRRARGARLSPADQQSFSRDSTSRGDAVARGRALRETLQQQAAVDSAAAQTAFEPSLAAYRELVAAVSGQRGGGHGSGEASTARRAGRRRLQPCSTGYSPTRPSSRRRICTIWGSACSRPGCRGPACAPTISRCSRTRITATRWPSWRAPTSTPRTASTPWRSPSV